MIRDALGPSPLDDETRQLAEILSSGHDLPRVEAHAADWAVAAFRRAGADDVRIEKFGGSSEFENVIAEIHGRDHPQDYVLIATPLADLNASPLETAENAAILVDAARVIHATGNIPRRSIRFVLFGAAGTDARSRFGGVWAYMQGHATELDRVAAAVTLDDSGQGPDGYSLQARPDTLAAARQSLAPLQPLGIRHFGEGISSGSSVTPFWLEGVPTLVAMPAGASRTSASLSQDDIDPAKLKQLKRDVAIAAVTAYALADAESRIGPRQSISGVRKSIESLALEPQLRTAGVWNDWQALQSGSSH